MNSINYLHVLSDQEVKDLRKQQIKLVKDVLDGKHGITVSNMLSSFLHNIENLIEWNDIPTKGS